jgi:hypothetical protein
VGRAGNNDFHQTQAISKVMPTLVPPKLDDVLLLYISTTDTVISIIIVVERHDTQKEVI